MCEIHSLCRSQKLDQVVCDSSALQHMLQVRTCLPINIVQDRDCFGSELCWDYNVEKRCVAGAVCPLVMPVFVFYS